MLAPALLLAGCAAGGPQLPERPGIYAKTDGERARLIRLSDRGAGDWSDVASLPKGADLLVANAGMGSDPSLFDDYVTLTRAGWVRSRIAQDGEVRPTTGQQYAAPDLSAYRLRLSFSYLGQENGLDIVRVAPDSALPQGFYQLEVAPAASRDMRARFGVQTADLSRDRYAQDNCLDRIDGPEAGYRPCAADAGAKQAAAGDAAGGAGVAAVEQQRLEAPQPGAQRTGSAGDAGGRATTDRRTQAGSGGVQKAAQKRSIDSLTPGLHIRDLSVDRARREDGDVLLIRGEVVNADTEKHELPGLTGRIIDPGGEVLQRWTFLPNARALAPGESARFTTVRDATEEGGKRVEIRFDL
jgi:hypothetical protein